jgi:predicted GIY-YIG superfamily endonuclease
MAFYVYLLVCQDNATYVGATVDLDRRLRQHNCEIKGGAHLTTMKVKKKGLSWQRACYISGFIDWRSALQFEWRWKQIARSKSLSRTIAPMERRLIALRKLLSLERSTTLAVPFKEWETLPEIHFELDHIKALYDHDSSMGSPI